MEKYAFAQKLAIAFFVAVGLWTTARAVVDSIRERRGFSKRRSYSLALDLTALFLSSVIGIAGAIGLMLILDRFGLSEKPFIWLSAMPLLLAYVLGDYAREKIQNRLFRNRRRVRLLS
jgi:4-hydroxybenzoate polyprenyltransferase